MKDIGFAVALMLVFGGAEAYDTGSLTCPRIGELAAETVLAKHDGTTADAQLLKLTAMLEPDAAVERKLVTNIVHVLYTNELLEAMKPSDAYLVFMGDCMRGRQQLPSGSPAQSREN
ncbi:MAG: hypothetical protein ABI612_14715 [Betaproteobacteria bacterium]